MMKPYHIRTRHFHLEIRPPNDKSLDLNDEYDMQQAWEQLFREYKQVDEEVKRFFKIVVVDEEKPKLTLNPKDFP